MSHGTDQGAGLIRPLCFLVLRPCLDAKGGDG